MPYVIGTAGHIDHGKTSLVKALTGIDTDRLKEEKERGISIDLGFAHLDLADGTRVGIVDVPGHERFIRNMLAGAHGIDLALFTVAADDGVMPQTQEHFDIVRMLGIQRAIFAITKSDKVSASRVTEIEEEIRILISGTALETSPVVPVSSVTNDGLDRLKMEITRTLGTIARRAPDAYFRMPIDRVFTLQGHGLVVTGTALAGEVATGDRLFGLPDGQTFRVRRVQVHGEAVERASWGQRIALNLAGHEKPTLARGSVVTDERLALTTSRFDAVLEACLPGTSASLRNHQRVRLHLGTAEHLAKIVLLGGRARMASKEIAFCQIVARDPLSALRGDRFVIRDETATHTLGGGVVLNPFSSTHRRRDPAVLDALTTYRDGTPEAVAERFVDDHEDLATTLDVIARFLNRTTEGTVQVLRIATRLYPIEVDGEQIYTTARKWGALADAVLDRLRAFHRDHPLAAGHDMEELRDRLPWSIPARTFRAVATLLEQKGIVTREGGLLRLPGHSVSLPEHDQQLADRILAMLRETPLTPPDIKEMDRRLAGASNIGTLLRVLERRGRIIRVSSDLYFLADALANVRDTLQQSLSVDDSITPALFRDRFGTSRKYAIPLLEYLDREGITQRIGDVRRLKRAQPAGRA